MALSNITQAIQSNWITNLAMFQTADGKPHFLWAVPTANSSVRRLFWRAHDAAEGTETGSAVVAPYNYLAGNLRSDNVLLVVYDNAMGQNTDPSIFIAAFNYATGATVIAPTFLCKGSSPSFVQVPGADPLRWTLSYRRTNGHIYVRESYDNGATWSQERPVLNNKVRESTEVAIYGLDAKHVVVAQVGDDARKLLELGSYTRTRPFAYLVKTVPGKVIAVESVQRTASGVAQLNDSMRGGLVVVDSGNNVWATTRTRQGVDDGIGDLVLFDVTGAAPTVISSTTVSGDNVDPQSGNDVTKFGDASLALVQAVSNILTNTNGQHPAIVDLAASPSRLYMAGYSDAESNSGGAASWASSAPTFQFIQGKPCHAITIDAPTGTTPIIAVAYTDTGTETIAFYSEGATLADAPTLRKTHRMPSRVNRLLLKMDTATVGKLYVAMKDRLDVYLINGLDRPIQRAGGWSIVALGQFHDLTLTTRGNIIAALGEGGVGVFSPNGDRLAQVRLTGTAAGYWKANKTYVAGDLVQPTVDNPYAPLRHYFKCTVGGAAAAVEPQWGPGTVTDGAVTWQEVGPMDGVATSVDIDESTNRIFVAGLVGGEQSTLGRVYIVEARDWRI